MKDNIKKAFAILLCISLGAYATFKQMQLLAVISLIATLAILYKYQTQKIINIILDLLSSTRQAKLGKMEVQIDKKIEDISDRIAKQVGWVQILLSQLTGDEIGLLLAISKTNNFSATNALKEKLRKLRSRGLIQHNMPTMTDSDTVWLTEVGKDFVKILIEAEAVGPKHDKSDPSSGGNSTGNV